MQLADLQKQVQELNLAPDLEELKEYPDIVAGRTAHIDADFLAYMAAYEHKDHPSTLEDILHKTDVMIEDKRRECAADFSVLHLTPSKSNKGGRYDTAIQKQYQAKRSTDKPRFLSEVRDYMGKMNGRNQGKAWMNAEADDGMAHFAWLAHERGTTDRCVIATKDKDLRMCPGLHLDWDTGIIEGANDSFGYTEILTKISKAGKKNKKLVGYGTKFFWTQMLMGDPVDNIQGVPKAMIADKFKLCGLVGAFELLENATNDRECFDIVGGAYKQNEYHHWQTGDAVKWGDVFWSEAQMLWMQRTPGNVWDVKEWVKENVL